MKLSLNGLSVACILGERPDERVTPQVVRVEVELEVDARASETDRLADAVDYAALSERIRAALVAAKCQLLERAAKVVCDLCLEDNRVRAVRTTVAKSGAVPHLDSASVTLEECR